MLLNHLMTLCTPIFQSAQLEQKTCAQESFQSNTGSKQNTEQRRNYQSKKQGRKMKPKLNQCPRLNLMAMKYDRKVVFISLSSWAHLEVFIPSAMTDQSLSPGCCLRWTVFPLNEMSDSTAFDCLSKGQHPHTRHHHLRCRSSSLQENGRSEITASDCYSNYDYTSSKVCCCNCLSAASL